MRNSGHAGPLAQAVGKVALALAVVLALCACVPAPAATGPSVAEEAAALELPQAGGRGTGSDGGPASPPAPSPRAQAQERSNVPAAAFPYAPQPEWIPTRVNHDVGREDAPVEFIVIHYTAISYARTLVAFNNPHAAVSAHYVVRGDGHIAQLVGEADTAWHAGNYWYNRRSVGIELELDAVTNPSFTPQQYYAAAALACAIAARHDIPLDRAHVFGHNEVPWPNDHSDPGPTWGWPHFMWLTSLCAPPTARTVRSAFVSESDYPDLAVGQWAAVTVSLRNTGTTAWRRGTGQEAQLAVRGNDTSLAFLGANWPAADRPAIQNEDVVVPGDVGTFTFRVRGSRPGTFTIPLRGVVDGGAWMDDEGIHVVVKVHPPAGRSRSAR